MAEYDKNVFINCPFDAEYDPILQSILFCILYLGFEPRIASTQNNSAENRLANIVDLIKSAKLSIHDLSRCEAKAEGELSRLNMPFELGIDFGCRKFARARADKKILVLEEKQYRYQAALSDFAGCDIKFHSGDFEKANRHVRNWLVGEGAEVEDGATRILDAYYDFQGWHYEQQLGLGFSEADIQNYPTTELLKSMKRWFDERGP